MNKIKTARICATVKPLALLFLVNACGSPVEADGQDGQPTTVVTSAGSGGGGAATVPNAGASVGGGISKGSAGAASAGGLATGGATAGSGGSGSVVTSAGMGGVPAATGGQPGGTAGTASGGAPAAGAGGMSQGGMAQAGAPATDPLAPKPAEGCPGYIDILVPKGTCIWLHGAMFSSQTPKCDLANPREGSCATVSATTADIVSRVSSGAQFDRLDIPPMMLTCAAKCQP